jgi:threonine synthase
MFKGCPVCWEEGHPANLAVHIDMGRVRASFHPDRLVDRPTSMWRYHELLPADLEDAVTMGEGMTPLVPLRRLGRELGMPNLYAKVEGANPTWSFKDRLASSAVSVARAMGSQVITGSSSGNAGAATAAYSARAGLPCVMFTTQQFPAAMKVGMAVYGTLLVAMPTIADRWTMVAAGVERLGWFPVTIFMYPLVGSNPHGIEGYKTIAFELVEQLGRVPDHVVFPVGAGDAFSGAWKGFSEYRALGFTDRVPVLHAAEVFGPLQHALETGSEDVGEVPWGPTPAISVGLNTSAYQALSVLRESGGAAETATETQILDMQRRLAATEGIYAEASSVLTLAALPRMVERGAVDPDGIIVTVLTSSGLKDPDTTLGQLPAIPLAEPDLDVVLRTLQDTYGVELPGAVPA